MKHSVVASKGASSSPSPKANENKRRVVNAVGPARGTRPTKPHEVVAECTRKVNVRRSSDSNPREKIKAKEERKRVVGWRGQDETVSSERSKEGLTQRLEESESVVGLLKAEVLGLKKRVEELQIKNDDLEEQNRRYRHDLSAAEAKIQSFQISDLEKSEKVEKLKRSESIADELEKSEKEEQKEAAGCSSLSMPVLTNMALQSSIKGTEHQLKLQTTLPVRLNPSPICVPLPPPPPPPPNAAKRGATMQKSTSLVEFYHSLTKRKRDNCSSGIASCSSSVVNKAHNSVVGEIQNRSAHLLAIKADVETKGEFVNSLAAKVHSAAYNDIEQVSDFIEWLDKELSTLSDERAVLKHFYWPEKKADAMREAAFEYRALKRLQVELETYEDDRSLPFESAMKKMEILLDKSERSFQRLRKLSDGVITSYGVFDIPTNWMLDSGIINKVKLATMKLAKICMKRVPAELESMRHSEKETAQEALLLQCVRYSYRVHQFAGGLDTDTVSAFDELRRRINGSSVTSPRNCSFLTSMAKCTNVVDTVDNVL